MSASLVSVFIDGGSEPLLKCPFSPGVIPDESKAMSLLAPANAVAGMMPGGGLLPTPNPLATVSRKRFNVTGVYLQAGFLLNSPFIAVSPWLQMAGTPFGGLGAPNMEQIAAMGIQGPNMNPQVGVGSTPCSLHVGQT